MEQYRFFIDRKVTSWVREWHEVEAESLDAAKKEMVEAFHDNMCVERNLTMHPSPRPIQHRLIRSTSSVLCLWNRQDRPHGGAVLMFL